MSALATAPRANPRGMARYPLPLFSLLSNRRDEEVTETPSIRNGIATMASYCFVARQERGIHGRTAPVETFDEVGGELVAEKGWTAVSSPSGLRLSRLGVADAFID